MGRRVSVADWICLGFSGLSRQAYLDTCWLYSEPRRLRCTARRRGREASASEFLLKSDAWASPVAPRGTEGQRAVPNPTALQATVRVTVFSLSVWGWFATQRSMTNS